MTHVTGGLAASSTGEKVWSIKKRVMIQIVSVTAQVAISEKVERYKLALQNRQAGLTHEGLRKRE